MSNTVNKRPIEIGILEISSQNRAILEYFFSDAGKSYFKEVSLDQASAYIIDYDSLGAKESWESTFKETKKPGIIISIREVDLPSTIWLQKPLTVKALKEAGESIRETLLSEAPPELVIDIIAEKTEEAIDEKEEVVEIVESIIEPVAVKIVQEIIPEETPQIDYLSTEEIIDIPSESISQIAPKKEKKLEIDDFLIQETVETHEDSLLVTENIEKETSKVEPLILIEEEPELAMADTKASASSSSFATTTNFVDLDLSLSDSDENHEDSPTQKSSTTPIAVSDTSEVNEFNEIDSLLESLISGGQSNEKVDKLVDDATDNHADLLDFDLKTVEIEAENPEKETNDLPEPTLIDTHIIEDDGSSLEFEESRLEESSLEEPEAAFSHELITPLNSLETTATIDDEEINKILSGASSKTEKPKKTAEEELQSLLEEIRQEANETTAAISGQKGNSQIASKYAPKNAEERWQLTCGDNDAADLQEIRLFNPANHLLASLIKSVQSAKQGKKVLRMKFNGIIVVIDPETDAIYCDQSICNEYYSNICYDPMPQEKIKVHQLDASEIRLYRKKMKEETEYTHYTEAFIWTSSLLTSRGRLPKDTNINNTIGLKSWPNLTRVENIPHMMQIAALFDKNTSSLLDITNKSDIPKNYVIAFYNAALALDMIQTNGERASSAPLDLKMNKDKQKNKSFISRFIKKLTA